MDVRTRQVECDPSRVLTTGVLQNAPDSMFMDGTAPTAEAGTLDPGAVDRVLAIPELVR
jgi:hypothetical protein